MISYPRYAIIRLIKNIYEKGSYQYAVRDCTLDQDGNGDSDKNPYISVDFENNLESCLEAANMMEDEGYKEITPFILEDEGKSGTYTWEYVRQHSI